jgi:opacity protein-like surface antigen
MMKKSFLVLAASAMFSTVALADVSALTIGYAEGVNKIGEVERAKGISVKYHHDLTEVPFGFVGSFTYTGGSEHLVLSGVDTEYDGDFYSLTAGPSVHILDNLSAYALVGVSSGDISLTTDAGNYRSNDLGFAYGAGLKFNPYDRIVVDLHYEKTKLNMPQLNADDMETVSLGLGFMF